MAGGTRATELMKKQGSAQLWGTQTTTVTEAQAPQMGLMLDVGHRQPPALVLLEDTHPFRS